MAEAVEAVEAVEASSGALAGPSSRALEAEAEADDRRRTRDPPIIYTDIDVSSRHSTHKAMKTNSYYK